MARGKKGGPPRRAKKTSRATSARKRGVSAVKRKTKTKAKAKATKRSLRKAQARRGSLKRAALRRAIPTPPTPAAGPHGPGDGPDE